MSKMGVAENQSEGHEDDQAPPLHPNQTTNNGQQHVSVPLSWPVSTKTRCTRQVNSSGDLILGIPATLPREGEGVTTSNTASTVEVENGDGGEGVPEEKPGCRICLVELGEGDEFKLQCNCKGELALTHKVCARKWFSVKGNRKCEVCNAVVRNVHVTWTFRFIRSRVAFVAITMLALYCFIMQLMLKYYELGGAIIVCNLMCPLFAILSSMTATAFVRERYPWIWIHGLVQYIMVVSFTHMFYFLFHLSAGACFFLAISTAFFVALCVSFTITVLLEWRQRSLSEHHRNSQEMQQQTQITAQNPGLPQESVILNIFG